MATASTRLTLDGRDLQVGGRDLLVESVFGAVAGFPTATFNLGVALETTFPIRFKTGRPDLDVDVNVVSFSGTSSILWEKGAGEWQLPDWWKDEISKLVLDNPSGRKFGRLLSETDFLSSTALLLYLPELFHSDPYLRDYFNAVGSEWDRYRSALDMVLCAIFVAEAPEWALRRWAEEVGAPQTDLTVEEWRAAIQAELTEVTITQEEVLRVIKDFGALDNTPEIAFPADYETQLTIGGVLSTEVQRRAAIAAEIRRRFPAHILTRPVLWLADIPSVPLTVGLVNVDGPPGGFDISWTSPTQTGGFPLTYHTRYKLSSASAWTDGPDTTDLDVGVVPLDHGSAYDVQVRASNDVGDGPWSASVSGTVDYSEPSAIRNLVLGRLSGGRIRVSWTAPQYTGGRNLRNYRIRWRLASGGSWSGQVREPLNLYDVAASSLGSGTWEVAVRAVNSEGVGVWTSGEVVAWTEASAVTNLSVGAESLTSVRVAWASPTDTGTGQAIDTYRFRYRLSDATIWTELDVTGTHRVISNLQRGRTYQFEVAARNSEGLGPFTRVSQTMGTGLPSPPEISSLVMGPTTGSLIWSLADDGGSDVVSYRIRYRVGSGTWTEVMASTATTHTVSGLSKNVAYEFQVGAVNETGNSPWSGSARGTTTTTVADAPTALTLSPTRTSVVASWTAPEDTGGLPITGYGWAIRIGGTFDNGLVTTPSYTFDDLRPGTNYEIRITTRNAQGFGPQVIGSVTLPTAVPDAPSVPTLSLGDTTISVAWSAPFDNGLEITSYALRYRPTGTQSWTTIDVGTSLAYSIAGLPKNTEYEVQVRATNQDGNGDWSESAEGTTLWTIPDAPESVSVSSSGTTFFVIGWSEPTDTGGVTIAKYEVRYRLSGNQFWTSTEVGLATTHRVDNRIAGETYQYAVRAQNTATTEWGPWSEAQSVTLPSS